jgi:hypothetical protein
VCHVRTNLINIDSASLISCVTVTCSIWLVPGLFGPNGTHNNATATAENDDALLEKLTAYWAWADIEPKITGLIPWHWTDLDIRFRPASERWGISDVYPKTLAWIAAKVAKLPPVLSDDAAARLTSNNDPPRIDRSTKLKNDDAPALRRHRRPPPASIGRSLDLLGASHLPRALPSLSMPPAGAFVIRPTDFGADPTGQRDSSAAFREAVAYAWATGRTGSNSSFEHGLTDLGGLVIDLVGGTYLLEEPLVSCYARALPYPLIRRLRLTRVLLAGAAEPRRWQSQHSRRNAACR